jgi:hypothetical protein
MSWATFARRGSRTGEESRGQLGVARGFGEQVGDDHAGERMGQDPQAVSQVGAQVFQQTARVRKHHRRAAVR